MGLVTVHRVDANDLITFVDDGFRRQAEEVGLPTLPGHAIGTNLFLFFAGEATRSWYHWLLDRVRESVSIRFHFGAIRRCYVESF